MVHRHHTWQYTQHQRTIVPASCSYRQEADTFPLRSMLQAPCLPWRKVLVSSHADRCQAAEGAALQDFWNGPNNHYMYRTIWILRIPFQQEKTKDPPHALHQSSTWIHLYHHIAWQTFPSSRPFHHKNPPQKVLQAWNISSPARMQMREAHRCHPPNTNIPFSRQRGLRQTRSSHNNMMYRKLITPSKATHKTISYHYII